MNEDDAQLAAKCRQAMPQSSNVPPFDAVLANADRRFRQARRWRIRFGAAAALGTLAVSAFLAFNPGEPAPGGGYIEMAELLNSTRWIAPSDVLLPRHEIDLYQELPAMPASTKPAPGALL